MLLITLLFTDNACLDSDIANFLLVIFGDEVRQNKILHKNVSS